MEGLSFVRNQGGRVNIPILVLSLGFSLALWATVNTLEDTTTRELVIQLTYESLNASKFSVKSPPRDFRVRLSGPAEVLKTLVDGSEKGFVNLANARVGNGVPYTVGLPPDIRDLAVNGLPKVWLNIEAVEQVTLPVETGVSGKLSTPGLLLEERNAETHQVKITGPHSVLESVMHARINVDLSKVRSDSGEPYEGYIDLYDSRNRQINLSESGLNVEPPTCRVDLAFISPPVRKPAFVFPVFGSHPNAGFRVDSYNLFPNTVTLAGTSVALASISKVNTEPVDLTGLTASHEFTVPLTLPNGVSKAEPAKVKVRVVIKPISAPKQ